MLFMSLCIHLNWERSLITLSILDENQLCTACLNLWSLGNCYYLLIYELVLRISTILNGN